MVVVAPDKFKGTLSAREVAGMVSRQLSHDFPGAVVRVCPMADGGDGTARILGELLGLPVERATVPDALGRPHAVEYYNDGQTAVVDTASVVGLAQMGDEGLHPFDTTSYGVGELVRMITDKGVGRLYLGIGGTATVDAGMGMLQALGAVFYDVGGCRLPSPIRAGMCGEVYSVDFTDFPHRRLRDVVVGLSDVAVSLADSVIFAGQKGVSPAGFPRLEAMLGNVSAAVDQVLGRSSLAFPHAGAGGGIGYAVERVAGCKVVSGADFLVEAYNLFDGDVDLVITGEGCLDDQTATGKVVDTIRRGAVRRNIPVVAVVGRDKLAHDASGDMAVIPTEPYMNGRPLNPSTARAALSAALHDRLKAICSRMWG